MSSLNKQPRFVLYFIVILSFFILFFITKDQYANIQENKDLQSSLSTKIADKEDELDNLNKWKNEIKSDEKTAESVDKYVNNIKDYELYRYIYDYVGNSNAGSSRMAIKSMNLREGEINEFGLKEGNLNLTLIVSNEATLVRFMDFLIRDNSKYNFVIRNFSYPNDDRTGSFSVNIPLTILYK